MSFADLPFRARVGAGALLALVACSDEGSREAPERISGPIRLGDLLSVAAIDSPLLDLPAATSLDDLGEVARTTLLDEGFEDFDADEVGWRLNGENRIAADGDGHVLAIHGLGRQLGWVFEAEPGAHYAFERRVRAETPPEADFAVVEAKATGRIGVRGPFDNHYMAGRGLAIKVHFPAPPKPDGEWERGAVSFFTTPDTRALAVVLRPTISQLEAGGADARCEFDDLRLERVEPSPSQAIALLKARSPAPGADPELGIEKFGQFPPLGEIGDTHTENDDNYSYRYALYAPPPTALGFELSVPAGAQLSFSVSLSRESALGDAARFEVSARDGEGETLLWSRELAAEAGLWRWFDERVDLSVLGGRRVELILRTSATAGSPHPVWGNPVLETPRDAPGPRNVILIAVDTLRADRLSCYGYGKDTSPHLDALAADGVRFDQVASNCNWTCPSFASIFTGLVPSRHGVFSYGPRTPLSDAFETLAERFRARGWSTEAVAYKPPLYDGGFDQGFDISLNVPREFVRASDNLTEALDWLERNADGRNFLFLHFNDPHQPFTQPPPYDRKFGPDPAEHGIELPHSIYSDGGPENDQQREVMRALYDGAVAYVDDHIGSFLEAMKARGLYDDAVIGFVADHGEQLWEHGGFGHGPAFGFGPPLLYDEVVRVPLIVKPGAGAHARGAVVGSQVRGFDVMPTLLELAGIPIEDGLDAQSLVPLMAPGAADAPDRIAVIETSGRAVALRTTRWKYVLTYGRRAREVLYDLAADPGETEDVAEQHPGAVTELRAQVLEYLLLKRPGRYLVGIGAEPGSDLELVLDGVPAAFTLHGLPSKATRGEVSFAGTAGASLFLVAGFDAPGPVEVKGSRLQTRAHARYVRGELQALIAAGEPGFHVFEGPPRAALSPGPRRTMDARQLETLRAMGYAGDEDED